MKKNSKNKTLNIIANWANAKEADQQTAKNCMEEAIRLINKKKSK